MKIVFVETSDIGAAYSAEACLLLGYEALFLCNSGNYQGDTLAQLKQLAHIECDTTDVDAMYQALVEQIDVTEVFAVTTLLDSRLEVAFDLADKLQVKGIDRAVMQLKSKAEVVELVPEFSPNTLIVDAQHIDEDAIIGFAQSTPEFIVKPEKLAGGIGAKFFNHQEVELVAPHIAQVTLPSYLDEHLWLLQEVIDGQLYSVEGFVENGQMSLLGLCSRRKIGLTESYFEFPVDSHVSPAQLQWTHDAVSQLVKRSGFTHGYFHIEVILGQDKNGIIDANMGRLGGGPLGELIPLAYNVEVAQVYAHTIAISVGIEAQQGLFSLPGRESAVGILYGVKEQRQVDEIVVPTDLKSFHTLLLDQDQQMPPMGQDNWSWIGVLSGKKAIVEQEIERIVLKAGSVQLTPYF